MLGQNDKSPPIVQASVQPQDTSQSQEGILTTQFWGKRKLPLQYITPAMNAFSQKQGGGNSKGGGGGGTAQYKWFADSMAVLCLGPVTFVGAVWVDRVIVAGPNVLNTGAEYFQFAVGNYGQCRFSFGNPNQNFPSFCNWSGLSPFGAQRGKARVEFQQFYFGGVGKTSMPTIEFECIKTPVFPGLGNQDPTLINFNYGANPIAIIYEILTNTFWGAGIPANQFDTGFIKTQIANLAAVYGIGMWISPLYTSQQPIRSVINDLLQYFDGYIYRANNGLIRIGFWPHQSSHTPVATFDMDKIVSKPRIKAPSFSSTANEIHITWTNSQNKYVTTVSRVGNPSQFYKTGAYRNIDLQRAHISHPIAAYIFQEDYIRIRGQPQNTGQIDVLKSAALTNNPADIVTVSLGDYGASFLARIKTWNYGDEAKDTVTIDVEQELGTFDQHYKAPPDRESVASLIFVKIIGNSPKIISLPGELRTGDYIEMAFLAERTESYSYGFIPWISTDNSIFDSTHEFCFFGVRGVIQSVYKSTDATMLVRLSGIDAAQVVAQTAQQFFNQNWLVFIDNEIGVMDNVVALGGGLYYISASRGAYGSIPVDHQAGTDAWFIARADLVPVRWTPFAFGKRFYAKFQTLNHFNILPLQSTNSFSFVVGFNPASLYGPTNLAVGTDGSRVDFTWTLDPSPVVRGYQIRYGKVGGNWQQAKIAVAKTANSHGVTAIIPVGTWIIYVASFDANGVFSTNKASVTFTVPRIFTLVELEYGIIEHALVPGAYQRPDWDSASGATLVNCQVHPTEYILVPSDQALANYVPAGGNGFEVFDNFNVIFPASCSYQSPSLDSLGMGVIRCNAALYLYMYGLVNIPPGGLEYKFTFQPSFNQPGLTITGGVVHPTEYVVIPQSTVLASSGSTGFEVFDNMVYLPVSSTSLSWVQDTGAVIYPSDLTLQASVQQSPDNQPYKCTTTISDGTDGTNWTLLAQGNDGTLNTSMINRYALYQVSLDNTVGVASISAFTVDTLVAPPSYFPDVPIQVRTSPDNITWSTWMQAASIFNTDRYSQYFFQWSPQLGTEAIGAEALWLLLDAPQNIQTGVNVAVPSFGLSITFTNPYRSTAPSIHCTVVGPSAYTAIVTAQSKTGFTVQLFNAGVAVSGFINFTATGV